mmetsp:Transcript_6163/g.9609  ORF Transcript_6163/g.9609 Transcript_6163/m.9609 type:complete len:188 (+) Transcript_6163:79-642(+)
MMPSSSCFAEKGVIGFALLAGFPLSMLDEEMLGKRRFVWVGASFLGLVNLLLVAPGTPVAFYIDKACLSLLAVALVPHFIQLVKDQQWMGLGVLPPLCMVIGQSMTTPIDGGEKAVVNVNQDYWRLRAFLHFSAYILPYLNHLPSSPSEEEVQDKEENYSQEGQGQAPKTTSDKKNAAKTNTNKKKR